MADARNSRSLLEPDRYFARISHIDIDQHLLAKGYEFVLLDIDNTIRSRLTHDIPRDVRTWMAQARNSGIKLCFLSNNWHSDVRAFAGELDIPIVAKACKPLPFGFMRALRKLGAKKDSTVVVGDQILTDVLGAHLAGMAAYLVQPLAEVDLKHTLALRNIERSILKERMPEPATINMSEE